MRTMVIWLILITICSTTILSLQVNNHAHRWFPSALFESNTTQYKVWDIQKQ